MRIGVRKPSRERWLQPRLVLPIALLLGFAIIIEHGAWLTQGAVLTGAIILAFMFTCVPVLASLAQGIQQGRRIERLNSFAGSPICQTVFYLEAQRAARSIRPTTMGTDYLLPILVFSWIVLFGMITIIAGFAYPQFFASASVVLGGSPGIELAGSALAAYQEQTFAVGAAAFLGAYAYVAMRIIDRTANADLAPITFYRYAAHILIACVVAGIARHGLAALGLSAQAILTPLGFFIGRYPDLMIRKITQSMSHRLRIVSGRAGIEQRDMPGALPLHLIDDIEADAIDRFAELQILSAFDLATANPISLMLRLPHDLTRIVAWVAQAQLAVLLRPPHLAKARQHFIVDIISLATRLEAPATRAEIAALLGIGEPASASLLREIMAGDQYANLVALRHALRSPPGADAPDKTNAPPPSWIPRTVSVSE